MKNRRILTLALGVSAVAAIAFFSRPKTVRAQSASHPQIASFSVSADKTLVWPNAAPSPFLSNLPDEHTTFVPPASTSAPYLVWGASRVNNSTVASAGAVVLQTTDLSNFAFATSLGYNSPVLQSPVAFTSCDPNHDTEFDENYAAPGSVLQDPTLPAGNLIMLYEAENHCPGGVNQQPYYATVGFARSSDNGKTWPGPQEGPLGNPASRFPAFRSDEPEPSTPHSAMGDAIPSGFIDKSLDGNYYLYTAYEFHSDMGAADGTCARGPGAAWAEPSDVPQVVQRLL